MAATTWVRTLVPRPVRNAVRRPRATAAWLWHELAYAVGACPRWRVTPDWEVRCHPASLVSFRAQTEMDQCRRELAGFVRRCTPGMTLLDVGAHYGVFTLAALHYGGAGA